jgi:DNA-binding response OmpR family regulator
MTDPTKILVIDDEADTRQAIAGALAAQGYEVVEAENGRVGVNAFHIHRPSLVITDILMPEMDGFEVIRELRDREPKVLIIAISHIGALQNMLFLETAKIMGAAAVMAKPITATDLVVAVNALLTA